MTGTVLQIVESFGGWRLLDDGQPILWFADKESALATATVMAEARHAFSGKPTCVQTADRQGTFDLVADFG